MSQQIPPAALLVAHRVADYEAWKKAFDAHRPARQAAGCLGHDVNRDADDPNMLYVYCAGTDAGKLRAFVESADLPEVMKHAGVQGKPTVTLMKPVSGEFIENEKLPGVIVKHAVKDYAAWRKVYDEVDALRKKSGIVGHAVNQEIGNPDHVVVYHQARDLDALRKFIGSPELKAAMERAGVVPPVDVKYVHCVDIVEY